MVLYRELRSDEITVDLFHTFIRKQIVTDCRRKENGQWVIKNDPFVDDWGKSEYEFLVKCLKNTVATNGLVYGAFVNGDLKGFVSVEGALMGSELQYMDLSSIHVSQDMRGQGIGRELFAAAKRFAGEHGAKKLYISSHSAVESQAFYQAMGCIEAKEYNAEHVEKEPYDCQLECEVSFVMQEMCDVNTLIEEFNALGIPHLRIESLNRLNGSFVNLEYQLANGQRVKLLEDNNVYWGNQVEIPGSDRCYGLVADEKYLLVCEYGCGGAEPEIVIYKRR